MKINNNHHKKIVGFTLLEIVLAGFIFILITAVTAAFVVYYFQGYEFSFEEARQVGAAQTTMTTMIREIREARASETGAWPLVQTDDNELILYSDVTNDGRADQVRYFLDGDQIKKGVIEPTDVPVSYPPANEQIKIMVDYVDNGTTPLFTYYNGDWPGDTVNNPLVASERLLNTRYISIYIKVNIDPDSVSKPYELNSATEIRSMKDNL